MKILKKYVFPALFVLGLVAIDRFTKYLAYTKLPGNPVKLIDGVFELCYVENTGAAFGLFKDSRVLFLIITVIVLAALIFAYIKLPHGKYYLPLRIIALFIIAGALGNMIDRIFQGFVVDFMYISLIDFPVFNVADIYVSWFAVLALILLIFKYKESDFISNKTDDK